MKPFFIAIAGPSCSGKTLLAHALQAELGKQKCQVLSLDAYYQDLAALPMQDRVNANFDSPQAIDSALLFAHLSALEDGQSITPPIYDFATHTRSGIAPAISPSAIIIVEGIFALTFPPLSALFDLTVYLALEEEDCLTRRLVRDMQERGRDEIEIRTRFETSVRPSIAQWVKPQAAKATLFLNATQPIKTSTSEIIAHIPQSCLPDQSLPADDLPSVFLRLAERMGRGNLRDRLLRQASHWAGLHHQGEGILSIERFVPLDTIVRIALKLTGLGAAGRRGAQNLHIEKHSVCSTSVPPDLDGFRILQLSDLHLDLDTGILPRLLDVIPSLDYDLAVITGDFRNSTSGDFSHSIRQTSQVLQVLKKPVYGILGNHDFIEMVPFLEDTGLQLLLNETVEIKKGLATLFLAGIDDPHFYRTDDFEKVSTQPASPSVFRLLLSHSPETYQKAEGHFDFMLSGHTHGGQICLPGGYAVIRNGNCPSSMISGAWHYGKLQGYTSRGTGCCGVPARFFCPPEITIHTLHCTPL